MVHNRKKNLLINKRSEFFNFCAFSISITLSDFICRPRRVVVEILIKINKHIYPCIYDFSYILHLIKPTLKGPKQWPFPNIFSDYNTSSRCIYQNGFIQLRSIHKPQNSCIIEHEKYFVLRVEHSSTR